MPMTKKTRCINKKYHVVVSEISPRLNTNSDQHIPLRVLKHLLHTGMVGSGLLLGFYLNTYFPTIHHHVMGTYPIKKIAIFGSKVGRMAR